MRRILLSLVIILIAAGCAGGPSGPIMGPGGTMTVLGPAPMHNPRDVYHVVGPAETLWRISKTYDVDMETLLKVNHLSNPDQLKNGQTLRIPRTLGAKPVIQLYPTARWTHIVIHHTATHDGDAFSIDQMHHKRGFWNGLGYHFLVNNGTNGFADGQIQVGPRWIKQQVGAHANADGMNEKGIGIALVGNFSERRVSREELESLVFLVRTLQKYYRIPEQRVIRHRDVPGKNTECPGNYFPWSEFKRRIA